MDENTQTKMDVVGVHGVTIKCPEFLIRKVKEKADAAKAATVEAVAPKPSTKSTAIPATTSTDLLYAPGEAVFGTAGPMMLAQGWSVFPQERNVRRWPSKVNGKSFEWSVLQNRLPTGDEMTAFCCDAALANVAACMGEASGKVFALDVDCMDEDVSTRVQKMAFKHLGQTPLVRVGRAPKTALFYRYADLSPHNTTLKFADHPECGVEVQAHRKTMTLYGMHHVTGRYFHWPDLNPLSSSPSDAPEVTLGQVEGFLNAVRAGFKIKSAVQGASSSGAASDFNSEVSEEGLYVPTVGLDEKLTDGRERYLTDLTWNLVRRNQEAVRAASAAGGLDAMSVRLTDLAQKCFQNMCEMTGQWTPHQLCTSAGSKVSRAVAKCMSGKPEDMKPYTAPRPKREAEVGQHAEQVAALAALAGKSVIRVVEGEMSATVDAAEASLISGGAGVYQRGGYLVRIGAAPVATAHGIVSGRQILEMEEHSIAEVLGSHATYLRKDSRKSGDGMAVIEPPMSVVRTLAARKGFWKLPVLAATISAPTLRADGSLLMDEGHDAATGLLLESGGVRWDIPLAPTREQSLAALGLLKDLVSTFPFVGDADRSVVLSMMLTASVRRSLAAAPMHALSARAAGSGKSKLADLASVIGSGRPASVLAMGHNEEETEKRIGALLMTGDSVMAIDNVEQPLAGDFLCQVLTQPIVRTRVLGKSEVPQLPTCVLVTATGNNLRVEGDMTRRTLLCMLDADCERPELRVFETDPVDVAMRSRQSLVTACLTVLRGFITAGRPKSKAPLGSFEAWSGLVRDALLWLEEADPVATMEAVRASDPKREKAEAALTQWLAVLGEGRVTGKDVIAAASAKDGFDFRNPEFREAMIGVAGDGGAVNSRFLGAWMSKTEGRFVAGMKLTKGTLKNGIQQWSVSKVAPAPAAAQEGSGLVKPKFLGGNQLTSLNH